MFKNAKGIFSHLLFALLLIPCGAAFAVNPDYIQIQDLGGGAVSLNGTTSTGLYIYAKSPPGNSSNAVYLCTQGSRLSLVEPSGWCPNGTKSLLGYHLGVNNQSYNIPPQICLMNYQSWPSPICVMKLALGAFSIIKRTTVSFGRVGNVDCTGRCGIGCTWMPYDAWTPECLVHDQCLQSTSTANPACWGPMFDAAAVSYIFALDPVYNKASNFIESILSDLF